jgi:endonuclease G, mitochondrial
MTHHSSFNNRLSKFPLLATLCAISATLFLGTALAAPNACLPQYHQGVEPKLVNPRLAVNSAYICTTGYAAIHSGQTKTGLYSAEKLTRERIAIAKELNRVDSFHPEPSISVGSRAELNDYKGSGYDRGHLAPNKDMADRDMQQTSFSLGNMVPQVPENNRQLWEGVESATRKLVSANGEGYIVTGPAFIVNQTMDGQTYGSNLKSIGRNNVIVPTHMWKALFIPSRNIMGVYWAKNDDSLTYEVISVNTLVNRTGIDPFPSVSQTNPIRQQPSALPKPQSHSR